MKVKWAVHRWLRLPLRRCLTMHECCICGMTTAYGQMYRDGGYGRLVVIDHGFGVTTWYGHLSGFNVQPGMRVKAGDVIGYEGDSGRSTGPHLHYEIRIYNTPVNPWPYLRHIHPTETSSGD